jgi:hypothetical protein
LLLVQHFAHLIWLIRPTALHTVPAIVDIAVLAVTDRPVARVPAVGLSRRPNLARLSR